MPAVFSQVSARVLEESLDFLAYYRSSVYLSRSLSIVRRALFVFRSGHTIDTNERSRISVQFVSKLRHIHVEEPKSFELSAAFRERQKLDGKKPTVNKVCETDTFVCGGRNVARQ